MKLWAHLIETATKDIRLCLSCGLTDDDFKEVGKQFNQSRREAVCYRCQIWGSKYGWCSTKTHCLPPKTSVIFPPNSLRTSKARDYPRCKCKTTAQTPSPNYSNPSSKFPERIPIEDEDIAAFKYIAVKNREKYKNRQIATKQKRNKRQTAYVKKRYKEDPEFKKKKLEGVLKRMQDPEEKVYRSKYFKQKRASMTPEEQVEVRAKRKAKYQAGREAANTRKREAYSKLKTDPKKHKAYLLKQKIRRDKKNRGGQ